MSPPPPHAHRQLLLDSILPFELQGPALRSGEILAELGDGVRYNSGSRDVRGAVENRRVRFITQLGEHPALDDWVAPCCFAMGTLAPRTHLHPGRA